MDFDLKRLTHVLAVAEHGSVTLAAEQLGLTQSGLSRSISSLEAAWRVRLFERSQKGVRPTRIGAEFLIEARRLLEDARTLDHNMMLRRSGTLGKVRFGAAPLIGSILTGPLMSRSLRETPSVSLTSLIKPLPDLLLDLRTDKSDFAIFSEDFLPQSDEIVFEPLGPMPLELVVRQDHPLGLDRHPWEALADYPLAAGPYLREVRIPCLSSVQCDNYIAMRQSMMETDAICLTSPWLLRDALANKEARILEIDGAGPRHTQIHLAYASGRLFSPAAELLIGHAKMIIADLQRSGGHDSGASPE